MWLQSCKNNVFVCVSNLFQDKSADTNQSHGLTHGPAANSRRLGPKGASATFQTFHALPLFHTSKTSKLADDQVF